MLDTNICIYCIKRKPEQVLKHLKEHTHSEICISAITYAELMHGVEKSEFVERNRLALTLFLAQIDILPFDTAAAEAYGRIQAQLQKKGSVIGTLDTMIAAHALSLGYTVVTNNTREFKRVVNLEVVNWTI
jgi:tRNA(fMet)-specific endonuclease VapC